jgi:hypothetical protein
MYSKYNLSTEILDASSWYIILRTLQRVEAFANREKLQNTSLLAGDLAKI